jgi:hypothetical protein
MPFSLVDCRKKASFRVLPLCRICALSLSVLCFPTTGTKMVCHLPLFLLLPLIFLGLYVSDLWGSRLLVVFAAAFCVISHEQGGYPQGAGEFLRLPHSICSANNFVFPFVTDQASCFLFPAYVLPPYTSVVAIL